MNDLISRSELIKEIKGFTGISSKYFDNPDLLVEVVEKQPTAYDVEKVIKQLEDKIKALGGASGTDAVQDTAVKEIMWCLDVVRAGGRE